MVPAIRYILMAKECEQNVRDLYCGNWGLEFQRRFRAMTSMTFARILESDTSNPVPISIGQI